MSSAAEWSDFHEDIVPELEIFNVNRPSNTKLRPRMAVVMGLHIYYNAFSVTGTIYVKDF